MPSKIKQDPWSLRLLLSSRNPGFWMHQETRFFISYFKRTKQATEIPKFISVCIDNEGHAEFQKTTTSTTPALVGAPRSFFFTQKNDLVPAKL